MIAPHKIFFGKSFLLSIRKNLVIGDIFWSDNSFIIRKHYTNILTAQELNSRYSKMDKGIIPHRI